MNTAYTLLKGHYFDLAFQHSEGSASTKGIAWRQDI